ncbi:integrase [Streptococcus agalactiae]|nr:integrase [Streptococcus agalactiae]
MQIESYQKKNGTTAYRFRIYIGVIDGKKKYIKRSGFTSKKIAKQAKSPKQVIKSVFHNLLKINNFNLLIKI